MRPLRSTCLLTLVAGLSATALPCQTVTAAPRETAPEWQSQSVVPPTGVDTSTDCVATTDGGATALGEPDAKKGNTGDARLQVPCVASVTRTPQTGDTTAVVPTSRAEAAPSASPQTALPADTVRRPEAEAKAAALESSLKESEEPQPLRAKMPYRNIPALRDLYTQVPSTGSTLRRFGSEAFLLGTGNANLLPSDLPVGPDYVLGVGDQLVVNMWGSRAERLSVTVDRQGQIALPEAGTLPVSGMTIVRAQEAVQKALNTQFKDERVEISMGRLRTVRVYVVGDVQRPGAYDVNALSTPLSVLYAAGGPTARGSLRLLRQVRGDKTVAQVDLYEFLLKGVKNSVERLQPGDTIVVPPVGQQVTVEGAVHHPAIYELNGESNLQQVLELAGGVLPTASLSQIEVLRVEANARRTMLSLEPGVGVGAVAKALAEFRVQSQDRVTISQILPYNQQAVYLAGHVFRPGPYAFRAGLTLTDIVRSYQDILPEPAERGQIVRLIAPDFHPLTLPFQLRDVLMGNSPIALQPFDTVEIFGRYEADAPTVRIEGEVLRPGVYPLFAGMTVSALVDLAGGFDRSAYREIAGLTNYAVLNSQSVEIGHVDVALTAAMAGEKASNLPLKPGDVLSIRQMTGWSDIGSSVTLSGEIAHPGGYGLAQGERLSSVVKRAGGLRADAYPEATTFSRVQVQVAAEQTRQEMIQRLESAPLEVKSSAASSADEQQMAASLQAQRIHLLAALRSHLASGRMVVNISSDVSQWEGTPEDIVLRAGDTISIPKRPDFVLIGGQVYNPTAVSFVPGHDAGWYLNKGGGSTRYGDRKRAYVLRADGSVVARDTFGRGVMHVSVKPGDAVVVPEKLTVGSQTLKDVLATAQIVTSLALTAAVAGGL